MEIQHSINSIAELLQFFKSTKKHLFFIGPLYGITLLNLHEYMPTFEFITCNDPYYGALPFITVPESLKGSHKCERYEDCQDILDMPEVLAYMKAKDPHPNVVLLMPYANSIQLCKKNGLNYWGPPNDLYELLGNKVKVIEYLKKAEIPYIPNICSKVQSYHQLLQIMAPYKTSSIVIQEENGMGGYGTMFISSQADYKKYQGQLQNGKVFKIMGFRRLKSFAINAVATKAGTFIGPLLSELIGHSQLTPNRGGYCGNEFSKNFFNNNQELQLKVHRQICHYTEKLSNFLYRQVNYRGVLGYDFGVDLDTEEVFFLEMNPRLTSSTSLTFQLYQAQGHNFPIFLYHCLQFMGIDMNLDVQAINNEWMGFDHYRDEFAYMVFKQLSMTNYSIPYNFPAQIWKQEGENLKPTGKIYLTISELADDEVLFMPNRGIARGYIIIKRRCQDENFKLTESSYQLIARFTDIRQKGITDK